MFDLMWIAWPIGALAAAIALRRRAPAVALGLLGGVAGGALGLAGADGRAVPGQVAEYAVFGCAAGGVLGLFLRPSDSAGCLVRAAAITAFVIAPAMAVLTWNAMRSRCWAYDPATERFCAGGDLFYGVSGIALGGAILCGAIVTGLFLISALQAHRAHRAPEAVDAPA